MIVEPAAERWRGFLVEHGPHEFQISPQRPNAVWALRFHRRSVDQALFLRSPGWPNITPQDQSVQACAPCSAIQRRTSSTRQTVTRGDSFTGAGNVPATTRRHKVDLDMGTKINTCGCRRKPVSGRVALVESVVDMICPFTGTHRMEEGDPLCRDHARPVSQGR